jgi:hypothetical protein
VTTIFQTNNEKIPAKIKLQINGKGCDIKTDVHLSLVTKNDVKLMKYHRLFLIEKNENTEIPIYEFLKYKSEKKKNSEGHKLKFTNDTDYINLKYLSMKTPVHVASCLKTKMDDETIEKLKLGDYEMCEEYQMSFCIPSSLNVLGPKIKVTYKNKCDCQFLYVVDGEIMDTDGKKSIYLGNVDSKKTTNSNLGIYLLHSA